MQAIAGSPAAAGLADSLTAWIVGGSGVGVARFADAAALRVARAVGSVTLERGGRLLQLGRERRQLGDLVLSGGDLGRHELAQLILDRSALAAVPCRGQAGDLIQAAAELLGASDEREPVKRPLVIHPIPGGSTRRLRQQPDVLVVAQRRRRESAGVGDLLDPQSGSH